MTSKGKGKPQPPPARRITDEWTRLLFLNWVQFFCEARFGPDQTGAREGTLIYGSPADDPIEVMLEPPAFRLRVRPGGRPREQVAAIVDEAWRAAHALDTGDGHWRFVSFAAKYEFATPQGDLHFMRILGDHANRRLEGAVRFGSDIMLHFKQEQQDPGPVVLPAFSVDATFKVPGPGPGPFSDRAAVDIATVVRAVLAYATGCAVTQLAPVLWGAKEAQIETALGFFKDSTVGELTVDGNVLARCMADIAGGGEQECMRRLHGGLFAYEQALLQGSEFVCLVLFVSAIEALAIPNAPWHRRRLTKRFVSFMLLACGEDLETVMRHANFAQAFGEITSKTRFLEELYDRRSRPLHSGFLQHNASGMLGLTSDGAIRVALTGDLVRAALRAFIEAPFSSIVGHPDLDPDPRSSARSIPL